MLLSCLYYSEVSVKWVELCNFELIEFAKERNENFDLFQ